MLAEGAPGEEADALRKHVQTGRPLGSPGFVEQIEGALGRPLMRRKPGPKPKAKPANKSIPVERAHSPDAKRGQR